MIRHAMTAEARTALTATIAAHNATVPEAGVSFRACVRAMRQTGAVTIDRHEAVRLGLATTLTPADANGMVELPATAPVASCAHEDTVFVCPFCSGTVDGDTHLCGTCQQMVAPIRQCLYCDEDVTAFWPYTEPYARKHPSSFAGVSPA